MNHPTSCQCWRCGYNGETWTIPIVDYVFPVEVIRYERTIMKEKNNNDKLRQHHTCPPRNIRGEVA